jgi:hypothetical protein
MSHRGPARTGRAFFLNGRARRQVQLHRRPTARVSGLASRFGRCVEACSVARPTAALRDAGSWCSLLGALRHPRPIPSRRCPRPARNYTGALPRRVGGAAAPRRVAPEAAPAHRRAAPVVARPRQQVRTGNPRSPRCVEPRRAGHRGTWRVRKERRGPLGRSASDRREAIPALSRARFTNGAASKRPLLATHRRRLVADELRRDEEM